MAAFLIVNGCENNNYEKEIVIAQVGNTKLTQKQLNHELDSSYSSAKFKEEYLRNWVDTEILFQISKEENLLNDKNYFRVIETSRKEVAASIAIKDFLEKKNIGCKYKELKDYFNQNKDDFSFSTDGFVLNYISFKNEESAIQFREKAISIGWKKSFEQFKNDEALLNNFQNRLLKVSEIQSQRVSRVLDRLYQNEISLVVNTELNNFVVVQQIDRIAKNTVPSFNLIKDNVKQSYLVIKQRELLRHYLDSLITHKKVKIY